VNEERKPGDEAAEDPRVVSLGKAVADGVPVDWEGARDENPEDAALIDGLHFVEKVAEAHRRVLETAKPDDEE